MRLRDSCRGGTPWPPRWHTILIVVVAAALVLLLTASADAQCSMCRAALAGSNNAKFLRNFNIGVLVLLVPPVTIFCSIFLVLRKYRGDG